MKSEKKKKPDKRKRGARDEKTSWERLPRTPSGKQQKLQFYMDNEWIERMKRVAPILEELERNSPGGGIKKNLPGLFCMYCAKTVVVGLEDILEKMNAMKAEGETDAISSNTHNDG